MCRIIIIIIIISLIISTNLLAQTNLAGEKNNFIAGLTGGTTFSQVDGDTYGGFHQFGFVCGGFVYKKISRKIDAQLDITFKQKGSRKTADTENDDLETYYIKLNYIEFPIIARYHFWNMSAEAGVSLAALLSAREGDINGDYIGNPFKTFELGTIVGANYYFTKKLWANMRYGYSITPIRVPYKGQIEVYNPDVNSRKPGQYNSTVSLTINYAFK